jgi:2-polyprenyl-6-methoxyphenol hydroxylase-like FAD-dependent oxidoreductase
MPHDLVIVGGGLAGSCLALVTARQGASVLVLEREERFRDRIRGEAVHVWGTADAHAVGVFDQLRERCAHELDDFKTYEDGVEVSSRDLAATTPARGKELTFYHPEMQETLLECARSAGADLWRGARVVEVRPGDPPRVTLHFDGVERQVAARLVVGADGRRSAVRTWSGFPVQRDADNLRITGVLISGIPAQETTFHRFSRPAAAWNTQFIPLGRQRYRAYFVSGDRRRHPPIGGASGTTRFLAYARDSGVPTAWLEAMRLDGPLASFEGASWWVDHPYREGVALIGDAAAAADPVFGNGQSLALRDVRVLSRHLLADPDWDAAARRYAAAHDEYFGSLHRLERWYADAWFSVAPEKQPIRDHAQAAQERGDAPDNIGRGPDQPADDTARLRFLGH